LEGAADHARTSPIILQARGAASLTDGGAALRADALQHIASAGGVLLRGFSQAGVDGFRRFARSFGHELLDYEFGSTPRSDVGEGVYTSTEYPAHQHIPLHNEQAYSRQWPMKIWFYCEQPSVTGGETPIADSRRVLARLSPALVERFERKRLMYVRNYGNGLDVPWQRVFNTEDRAVVERYCRDQGIAASWSDDGELCTRDVCQATAVHPRSGEKVWFNQAHLFHVSALEEVVRETLLAVVDDESQLPRHVFYGDGSPIELSVLEEIRGVLAQEAVAFAWQAGDVLMLDNMLAAHGRSPFTGPRRVVVAMAEAFAAPASHA
jgi:alpha-ketoglutarate-dependent taurine dioxygenase